MLLEINSFRFGEFILEKEEKVLLRDGKSVAITPKTLQLLIVLVEKHGRLVEKDELMKAVWGDSFVEEGNLSYTMRLLRKALGDEKNKPRFVETVPKRGYRFIAKVEAVPSENDSNNQNIQTVSQPSEKPSGLLPHLRSLLYPITAFLIVCIVIGFAFWYIKSNDKTSRNSILSTPFSSEKLSTNGKVYHAVIMPDGVNIVYTAGDGSNKESIWLRHLESSNNTQIIPPSNDIYGGLATSPDGNFLYFSRMPKDSERGFDIYRVSIFGGIPTKFISSTQGWFSISPDGKKMSYVRCPRENDENCSLWIADSSDGQNERKLVSRAFPLRIGDNVISPDGKSVAFAFGQSKNRANEFNLAKIDLESGTERLLTAEKFFNIKKLAWLPNKSGLLVTASKQPINDFRIWRISAITGEANALTKNSENYSNLSLAKDGKILVSTQVKEDKDLYVLNLENPSKLQNLSKASSAFFASNNKILFQSIMSGNYEIWSINSDGSDLRQLTNNTAEDADPIGSPNNNWIYFVSNRTGEAQVWRMNADGSNQQQITVKEGGTPIFVTPDEKWIYYTHGIERTLWRVSSNGENEQLVLSNRMDSSVISFDGSKIAFIENQNSQKVIKIVSLNNLKIIKTLSFKNGKLTNDALAWLPDGNRIVYGVENGAGKIYLRIKSLTNETSQKILETSEDIHSVSFAPDGKSLAVVQGRWKHDAVILKGLY